MIRVVHPGSRIPDPGVKRHRIRIRNTGYSKGEYPLCRGGGGLGCSGEAAEERACSPDPCPDWTPWTDWSECSRSCGGGTRTKVRECVLPPTRSGGLQCTGDSAVSEKCNAQECPAWTEWTDWTQVCYIVKIRSKQLSIAN